MTDTFTRLLRLCPPESTIDREEHVTLVTEQIVRSQLAAEREREILKPLLQDLGLVPKP